MRRAAWRSWLWHSCPAPRPRGLPHESAAADHRAAAFCRHWRHRHERDSEVLHNLGYRVQGSDLADGANVRRLIDLGIAVSIGHDAATLGNAEVVVVSSAVH